MVMMEIDYSQGRLYDLWNKIETLHYSYLQMEESPEKLDPRIKLENCIKEFLSIASHNQKFYCAETAEVLYKSTNNKSDFSAYKAATGWNAIQMYASNLLSQPWRKEYRQIKNYCGFYKHQVDANLEGAEILFETMGYKYLGNGIMVLEGPICPDRVTHVSRDCLVAYVECQIMKTIWESYNASWSDILEIRMKHQGDADMSVRLLKHYQDLQFQEQNRNVSQEHELNNIRYAPGSVLIHSPGLQTNNSFPPLGLHNHAVHPKYVYGHAHAPVACINNYPIPSYNYSYSVPYQVAQPAALKDQCNGCCYSNGFIPSQYALYNCPVPTAQLIEVESQNNSYDAVDNPNSSRAVGSVGRNYLSNSDDAMEKKASKAKPSAVSKYEKESSQLKDWDYVYRDLESQGYSKDLGERGDILSPQTERRRAYKDTNRVVALIDIMNNLTTDDGAVLRTTEIDRDRRKVDSKHAETAYSEHSSYENLSNHDVRKSAHKPVNSYSKTLKQKATSPVLVNVQSKTLDSRKYSESKVHKLGKESGGAGEVEKADSWQCKSCTFINEKNPDVCEMCSKSKKAVEQPMEVYGSQCSQCTLVNPKGFSNCKACDNSLKDSATYV